jgi:hypothetical protein
MAFHSVFHGRANIKNTGVTWPNSESATLVASKYQFVHSVTFCFVTFTGLIFLFRSGDR